MPTLSTILKTLPTFRTIILISVALRVGLILYSEWHDAHSVVKYTDIDYRVFSDAAGFVLHPDKPRLGGDGEGVNVNWPKGPLVRWLPFNVGDPYMRETYRYTPLLAVLLTPNHWLHPSFGKYLFALCDILNGVMIYNLLLCNILPGATKTKEESKATPAPPQLGHSAEAERLATLYATIHLLNPLVFSISTRGSSESVLSLFVLGTLYAALKGSWNVAAVLLGVSTHWKIYPLIYGVACLGVVGSGGQSSSGINAYVGTLVNWRTVKFTLLSAGTFVLLGAGCYAIWGYPFLYESYLYHLHRLDHRHNFSPYFYLTYLTYPSPDAPASLSLWSKILRSPLTSFVPQMTLSLGAGLLLGRKKQDLAFAWFVQTVVFVKFNKVCTSQYFLWYLLLLPLLLPSLSISPRKALLYGAVWIGTQALWLGEAYRLEFLGEDVFFGLWMRGLIYVAGNCWVLAGIMEGYRRDA
ncbi:hypothetical protein AX16_008913 [Volvariella volvacea WC 439]|nr:hypothetical protein AX16_008913 [Volvariella volvacea WC 439]